MIEPFNQLIDLLSNSNPWVVVSALFLIYSVFITKRYFKALDRAETAADKIEQERAELLQRAIQLPPVTSDQREEAQ
ncbi:hypothetical protein ACFSGI_09080 [Paenibacillus nicotianae]|uniref:Uncharacterized protein n=1 Tax=Paenibacillus nicotianae TaxID=1526551 RepID=A0ABW4UT71_9BACL